MTIYLYFPRLHDRNSFVRGQRGECGGMDYCKGRFGECSYNIERGMKGILDHYDPTGSPIAKMIMSDVESSRYDLMRIQSIYLIMGWGEDLHNGNYEIQFSYDEEKKQYELWGYRYKRTDIKGKGATLATKYVGKTFKEICHKYRTDLESKIDYSNILTN